MYSRFAESQGWKMETKATGESGGGLFKDIVAEVSGDNVYGKLKYESGVHRVQWVPPSEGQGRVHTAKLLVAVIPESDDLTGSGSSSDNSAIRTYNFPQDRLVDHRVGLVFHELGLILEGKLDPIIQALAERESGQSED
jgi:protein subunit release factor A